MRLCPGRVAIPLALATLASCYNVDTQDPFSKCVVKALDPNWDAAKLAVDVSSPKHCPFPIPSGLFQEQDLFGIVTAKNTNHIGSIGVVPFNEESVIAIQVVNRLQQPVNKNLVVPRFSFSGTAPRSEVRLLYIAGTKGYADLFDKVGHDWGYLDVSFRDQVSIARGRADLSFTYTVASVISGPISAPAGTGATFSTSASNYRAPLTYKWWRNGTLLATTSPTLGVTAPSAGVSATYKVEMTDADGDKGTDTHAISGYPNSGGGGGGGGCVRLTPDPGKNLGTQSVGDTLVSNALPCP